MFVRVKVFPNSKKKEIIKKSDDSFEIKVKAEPRRGEANMETIEILSSYFKLPKEKIKLIKGFKQQSKIFKIN